MNFAELAASVAKQLSRDDARKSNIIQSNAEVFYACDAAELDQMSAHEAAAAVLAKRGVRLLPNEDATRALELFHFGMDWGRSDRRYAGTPGTFAADASDVPAGSFLAKYLGEP